MMKKFLIILMTMLLLFTASVGFAEAVIETESEPTKAPESTNEKTGALNLGIKADPDPTPTPTMPPASSGGTMMLAPDGSSMGGTEGAGDDTTAGTTETKEVPQSIQDLMDANGQLPRFGKTNKKGVNVRAKMNTKSKSEARIGVTGTAVRILDAEENGKDIWFRVEYGNATGYIRSDLLDVITEEEFMAAEASRAAQRSSSKSSGSSSSGSSSNNTSNQQPTTNVPEQSGIHLFSECTDANCSLCNSDGLG